MSTAQAGSGKPRPPWCPPHLPCPPEPPAEDHRLRPSVVPRAQTQPSARGFPRRDWETLSLKTALWKTCSLGRWRPSLGVKRGHALHLPASITGEGRAGLPLAGGTAWLSRLPPGSRTRGGQEPSSILLQQLGTLLLGGWAPKCQREVTELQSRKQMRPNTGRRWHARDDAV